MGDSNLDAAQAAKTAASENKLQIERLESQFDRTAKTIGNLQTIIKALAFVVTLSFAAGVYFATLAAEAAKLSDTVTSIQARLQYAEQKIAGQDTTNADLKRQVVASLGKFSQLTTVAANANNSVEPEDNGGGSLAVCNPGNVLIGLQLRRTHEGQRSIEIQCAAFGDASKN